MFRCRERGVGLSGCRAPFLALLLSASACRPAFVDCKHEMKLPGSYFLVEYRSGASVGQTPPPEVQETPSYAQSRESVHTIALKFPDSCRTEGAATATGTSITSRDIMGTNCGVWLAELERALTEQHYKVISWSALRQQQDTKQVSTYEAARTLGAEVVLVVNSMEQHPMDRAASAGASYKYFTSDALGNTIAKYAPTEGERPWLKWFASTHAGAALRPDDIVGLAATLDVTAVLAASGESIWFFRHSVSKATDAASGMRFLFVRDHPFDPLRPIRPEGLATEMAPAVQNSSTEDVEKSHIASTPENRNQAELHRLAREVANECVTKFHGVSK